MRAPSTLATETLVHCALLGTLVGLLGACRTGATPTKAPAPEQGAAEPSNAGGGDPKLPGITHVDGALAARLAKALSDKGKGYEPRTHHLEEDGAPKYTNRLIEEGSPYLLQHAHNPVNFFPWGQEAFDKAVAEDKPILLSIGYSTCHWCHVMERESFEDEEIAAYMNAHYVSIKVDREERPDLDDIYMTAVNMLVGRGGWPMTVILTAEKQPFFGGTYFPPRDGARGARKGFLTILREMKERYATDRQGVVAQASQLSQRIAQSSQPRRPGNVAGEEVLERTARALASRFDPTLGGFGRAPKFPQPARIGLLLRYHRRTGDGGALRMADETLRAMSAGGMYDHVGGGFHRYSVDARWLIPHFEKMLYDNAQLASVYLDAFQATGDVDHRRVVVETLDYVVREMTHADGAFYSATDADSIGPDGHQEEGYYFTWTPDELDRTLGEDGAALVTAYYGVTPRGNFEGRTILHTQRRRAAVAKQLSMALPAFEQALEAQRAKLYAERAKRAAPGLDDKILTAWNGLMISAFARAGFVLGREDYTAQAARAADFLLDKLRKPDGRLLRSYRLGKARYNAYLDDHAFLVAALLDVYEATTQLKYLREAIAVQKVQDAHFLDGKLSGYFATSDDHEELLTRDKPTYDGAIPSGNSVAVMNLLRLAEFTTDVTYRARAEATLGAFAFEIGRGGTGSTRMLAALDYYHDLPKEIVIVAPDAGAQDAALLDVARRAYLPNRVLTRLTDATVADVSVLIPLVQGKLAIGGKTTAFVCEQGRCELPTSNPRVLSKQLAKAHLLQPPPSVLAVPTP